MNDNMVTLYKCNICARQGIENSFLTKGEVLAHHYRMHKRVSLK